LDNATAPGDTLPAEGPDWSLAWDVSGRLDVVGELTRVAYLLSPSAAVAKAGGEIRLEPAPDQFVRSRPDGSLQVLVSRRQETNDKGFVTSDLLPSDEDRNPNRWIDSNAPLIRRLVDITLSGETGLSEREAALELTSTAKSMFKNRSPLFRGWRRASEIGDVGDSTDHALVLTALLRANKIPARLASGVVYVPGDPPRMVDHSWTLAYVEGGWLSLDATLGTTAPPDRIIMGTTTLSEGTQDASLDAVLAAAGRIDIAILGAQ
jgi:transglutaminase-like putative cysteine protease